MFRRILTEKHILLCSVDILVVFASHWMRSMYGWHINQMILQEIVHFSMQRIVSHFQYLSASLWDVLEFQQIFLNTYLSVWTSWSFIELIGTIEKKEDKKKQWSCHERTAGIQQYAMEIPIQIENLQNKESELYCWDVLDAVSVILLMLFLIFRECFCSIMLFGPWCLHPTEWSTDSFIAGVLLLNPARVLKIIKHSSGKILNWSKALSVFRQREPAYGTREPASRIAFVCRWKQTISEHGKANCYMGEVQLCNPPHSLMNMACPANKLRVT